MGGTLVEPSPSQIRRREEISPEAMVALRRKWFPGAFLGAAALVIDDRGRYLLVRHRTTKGWLPGWSTPGGSPMPGETPEQCLRREVREEVGLELHDIRLVKVFDLIMSDGTDEQRAKFYQFEARTDGQPSASGEVSEARWFDKLPGDMAYREDYLDVLPGAR